MLKTHEIVLIALFVSAIWIVVLALQSEPSTYYQICETNQYTGKESCTAHHFLYIAFWYIGYVFNAAIITAIATAAIAAFTFTLWKSNEKMWSITRDSIDIARDDFNATHRPWIPITKASLYIGLNWAQGNAITGVQITCKNTGNSPAQRVSLAVAIFPFLTNDDIPGELIKLQKAHHTSTPRALIEHTLFPGTGELEFPRVLLISEAEIANLKDYVGNQAKEMIPVIVGSIEYYFSFGERTPHYTPFVFHLWLTDSVGVTRKAVQLDGKNVDARDMILVPLINAGEAT